MQLIYRKHKQMRVMHRPIMQRMSEDNSNDQISIDERRKKDKEFLTVNNRRFKSVLESVLNAKKDSMAICTRASCRLNRRKAVKLTKLYL